MSLVLLQCVHRDLAARNVLLGKDNVAMVSDFGLSRDVYQSGAYEQIDRVGKWMFLVTFKSKLAAHLKSLRFSDLDSNYYQLAFFTLLCSISVHLFRYPWTTPKEKRIIKNLLLLLAVSFYFLYPGSPNMKVIALCLFFSLFLFFPFYSFRIKAKAYAHSMDGHRVFKWFGIHHRIWRVSLFAHSTWNN